MVLIFAATIASSGATSDLQNVMETFLSASKRFFLSLIFCLTQFTAHTVQSNPTEVVFQYGIKYGCSIMWTAAMAISVRGYFFWGGVINCLTQNTGSRVQCLLMGAVFLIWNKIWLQQLIANGYDGYIYQYNDNSIQKVPKHVLDARQIFTCRKEFFVQHSAWRIFNSDRFVNGFTMVVYEKKK